MKLMQRIFCLLLVIFFIVHQSFGTNVSVKFSDNVYIKIISNENISLKVKNLNFTEINSEYKDNKYILHLKTRWNKERFVYNFSPIYKADKFNYVVKCDRYLSIKNKSFKNGILEVHTQLNYKVVLLGFMLFVLLPIFGSLIFIQYVKRILGAKLETITLSEKIEKNKKIIIGYMAYAIIYSIAFILSLFMCNLPHLLDYLSGISVCTSIVIISILYILLSFLPLILSLNDISRYYNKKIKKSKQLKLVGVSVLPWILGFVGIVVLTNLIIKIFGNFLKELPQPVNIAFWMIVGYVAFYPGLKIAEKYMLKPKYNGDDAELINMVNELTKKLNEKPFKNIKVIKNDNMANAMVSGLLNEKLILTTKLINILSKEELKSIMAHEIAHKKKKHIKIGLLIWLMVGVLIFSSMQYIMDFTENIFGDYWYIGFGFIMTAYILSIVVDRYFSKRREKEADIIASKITNPKICIKALAKLHYANYVPKEGIFNILSTHPPLLKRIKYIQKEFKIPENEVSKIVNEAYNEIEESIKNE